MRMDTGTGAQQCADDDAAGRVAHVVGVGFEGQAPHGKGLAGQAATIFGKHLIDQHLFLVVVDGLHGFKYAQGLAVFAGGAGQGLHVFGKAAAAVAGAGIQKAVANARV